MKKSLFIAICLFFIFSLVDTVNGQVRLPALVRDSMVIQRDTKVKIWGWASEGEQIKVSFKGKNYRTKTGSDGKWLVWLPPAKAGGPYSMEISGRNKILINNILVGDVWLCSGQSNMVHYMEVHRKMYAKEIASANYPEIRQFLIPQATDLQGPSDDLPTGYWKSANPEDIKRFSVVAYFFALHLYEKYHIPIGLINASVGGTPIEAWTSEEGLAEFPGIQETIQKNKDTAYIRNEIKASREFAQEQSRLPESDKGLLEEIKWYDPSYIPMNWKNINIPGYWEDQGIKELDGVVWYMKEIDIPASMTGEAAEILMGRIVDADFVYINGKLTGNTTYKYPQRIYTVPQGILKPGKNRIVIRVINYSGKGGFIPDKPYYLAAAGQTIDLKGSWQYKVGTVFPEKMNSEAGINIRNQPTVLYNAMIAPLIAYPVKGILWYQGESNAGRPDEYKKLLPALIADWRQHWNNPELPFLYVQLPNYMDVNYSPEESGWAGLREAQLQALKVPGTAMAVAIDLGEWNDVHPDNKKPVGDRLALAARNLVYNEQDLVYSGPIYRSYRIEGNKMIITFDHVGSGLVSGNGEELKHFAIAGPDKKFIWAKAIIENNTVIVWNDDIPNPKFVRYAWADNPDFANLYNKEGLPASPFRAGEGENERMRE